MRLKNSLGLVAFPLLIMVSGCGYAQSSRDVDPLPPVSAYPAASDVPRGYASSDQAAYDDVGYASVSSGAAAEASGGEEANPLAITAGHKSLPVPSYAEVTNLDTGRTILVRINSQSVPSTRLIMLSLGAARQLGVEGGARIPVRVRRTNPPEFERATLRQGQAAGERIETPPALLAALRKKLGATPADVAVVRPKSMPKAAPAKPLSPKSKPVKQAGADFDDSVQPAPTTREDRFIVEDASTGRRAPAAREQSPTSGSLFVQVAAFSSESRARSLARQVGGSVVNAGSIWRVRKGPYSSQQEANASLGVVVAKGYRDARVTR